MGCDIHPYIQRRENNKWITVYKPYDLPDSLIEGRSYTMFSILANVRNLYPERGGYIKPISEPRGWPSDFIDIERESTDRHSQSWITLDELENYDFASCAIIRPDHDVEEHGKNLIKEIKEITGTQIAKDIRLVFEFDN